jgi:hypothetical protein
VCFRAAEVVLGHPWSTPANIWGFVCTVRIGCPLRVKTRVPSHAELVLLSRNDVVPDGDRRRTFHSEDVRMGFRDWTVLECRRKALDKNGRGDRDQGSAEMKAQSRYWRESVISVSTDRLLPLV